MKNDVYTVSEVARMAGVGIKTLHHYDAIGLLPPLSVSSAGYRLYGRAQLERLQQILFYRELGFPLKHIHNLLNGSGDRVESLRAQRGLFLRRQAEVAKLIATIDRTIASAGKGHDMPVQNLFEGFRSEAEWNDAMTAQNIHLKAEYGIESAPVTDVAAMNDAALHAQTFTRAMIDALTQKLSVKDKQVQTIVSDHVAWLKAHGRARGVADFVTQTQFFMDDDFHRDMLESQQPGLSYYLNAAARDLAN
ncbi:MAG: MerR family transcriptional regulator [Asticcacaulis sp.]